MLRTIGPYMCNIYMGFRYIELVSKHIVHKLIFCLLAVLSLSARAESLHLEKIEQSHFISDGIGMLRFVLHNLESRPYSYETNKAEIQISAISGQPIQTIPVEVSFSSPSLDFIDLNDDGHVDLLLYNSDIPNGSIPLPEVFLYIPKLKKFVRSNTLSGQGEISKSKNHGCITITSERNMYGYTIEEWCFKLETGKWKMLISKRVELGSER